MTQARSEYTDHTAESLARKKAELRQTLVDIDAELKRRGLDMVKKLEDAANLIRSEIGYKARPAVEEREKVRGGLEDIKIASMGDAVDLLDTALREYDSSYVGRPFHGERA